MISKLLNGYMVKWFMVIWFYVTLPVCLMCLCGKEKIEIRS